MRSRTTTALVGLALSLLVSVVAWVYFDTLFLFLFLPLVPFLFARGGGDERPVRECPTCGFRTTNPEYAHCPRDGTPLDVRER
jgi:hypothetical protein